MNGKIFYRKRRGYRFLVNIYDKEEGWRYIRVQHEHNSIAISFDFIDKYNIKNMYISPAEFIKTYIDTNILSTAIDLAGIIADKIAEKESK